MLVAGLIGPSGAGKSTVSALLKKRGVFIIDGDKVAREILDIDPCVLSELADYFGRDIINEDGSLNRKLLGARAFSAPGKTNKLNEITHPHIKRRIKHKLKEAEEKGFKAAVIDAAALIESGMSKELDFIACVLAPKCLRLRRIIKRDKLSRREAKLRIFAQKKDYFYSSNSDIIIRGYFPYNIEKEIRPFVKRLGL